MWREAARLRRACPVTGLCGWDTSHLTCSLCATAGKQTTAHSFFLWLPVEGGVPKPPPPAAPRCVASPRAGQPPNQFAPPHIAGAPRGGPRRRSGGGQRRGGVLDLVQDLVRDPAPRPWSKTPPHIDIRPLPRACHQRPSSDAASVPALLDTPGVVVVLIPRSVAAKLAARHPPFTGL